MQSVCDHKNAVCVESTGGIESGHFEERYECPCGAVGFIEGEAEDHPQEWGRYGEVFN